MKLEVRTFKALGAIPSQRCEIIEISCKNSTRIEIEYSFNNAYKT